jgi:hypothetical protein
MVSRGSRNYGQLWPLQTPADMIVSDDDSEEGSEIDMKEGEQFATQ